MTSAARVEANRRNALRSTGPRTAAGKAKSSLNAGQHFLGARSTWQAQVCVAQFHRLGRRCRGAGGTTGGYVINTDRPPNASYLRLHRSNCRSISGTPAPGRAWTVTSTKICGTGHELEEWAQRQYRTSADPCPACMG